MGRRAWTDAERDELRRRYVAEGAAALARVLGRTVKAVHQEAKKLGLERQPRWPQAVLDQVRAQNARGLTDAAIARALPDVFRPGRAGSDQVKAIRQRLGRPLVPDREGKRRAVQVQYQRLGVRTAGELRAVSYRRYARENGWPEDLRPREVQVLNALAARGVPMTKPELAAAIGMPTSEAFRSGKRRVLLSGNGPGGTYTASLSRRGLIVSLGRLATVAGRGRGRSRCLYALGPVALAILQRRADGCEAATGATV